MTGLRSDFWRRYTLVERMKKLSPVLYKSTPPEPLNPGNVDVDQLPDN